MPWLRLMRLPNVFTALADVAMGYLFVHRTLVDPARLACLLAASAALYTAGMVLNDVFDVAVDAKERPFRPLPAGQISVSAARMLGLTLLALGVALGWTAGYLPGPSWGAAWRTGVVATALAACIVGYDAWLKATPLGPLGMGACRFLNVLLGMSVGPLASGSLGFGPGELLAAAGIGIYIVGVTWFARSEAGVSQSRTLVAAISVMVAGGVVLAASAVYVPARLRVEPQIFWILLGLLMFTVLRRCGTAALDPAPEKVQAAVKHSILSLIWFDAATALAMAGPVYAVAIAALLIPALLLGRWVYST